MREGYEQGYLLPIFAAVILGGIGDAFGALVGGLILGLMIEWSTLSSTLAGNGGRLRRADFLVLIVRPEGTIGRARAI